MALTLNLLSAEPTKPPPVGDQERERDFSSWIQKEQPSEMFLTGSNPSLKGTVILQNKCQQYTKHQYKQVVQIQQINHVSDFVALLQKTWSPQNTLRSSDLLFLLCHGQSRKSNCHREFSGCFDTWWSVATTGGFGVSKWTSGFFCFIQKK